MTPEERAGKLDLEDRSGAVYEEVAAAIRQAVSEEREACARLASGWRWPDEEDEGFQRRWGIPLERTSCDHTAVGIAEAIRARSTSPEQGKAMKDGDLPR